MNLGEFGEKYSAEYLKRKGYKILGRNVRIGRSEIDIIAKHRGLIVFIEVKTRSDDKYVDLIDSINKEQEEALIRGCEEYMNKKELVSFDYRFDMIGIIIRNEGIDKFEHLKGFL